MATATREKKNRRVGPKEKEAREQREAKAQPSPEHDADPAKAAAAVEAKTNKPKPRKRSGLSAKQAAIEVLREEGKPLPMKTICERVMERTSSLKGKTPHATINAIIITAANKGETFKRTARGVYGLREEAKA